MPGLEIAKAYASLLGATVTALLGVFTADTTVGQVLTVLAVILTAFVTWKVPNEGTAVRRNERGYTGNSWVWVIIGVMVFLILLIVAGVIHVG